MVRLDVQITNLNLPAKTLVMTNNSDISGQGRYAGSGSCNLYAGDSPAKELIGDIIILAPGYAPYSYFAETGSLLRFQKDNVLITATLTPSFNKPSRDQIVNVRANFCNLRDSEDIPIFDGFIDELILNGNPKADDWFRIIKGSSATHMTLDLSGDYNEYLSWAGGRYPIPGHDWSNDLSGFSQILRVVQSKGLIPIVKLGFDGQGYDPAGMTYGWQWGMDNIERIANGLAEFNETVMWSTGWDGCFPNWTPDQTVQMLRKMRAVLGDKAVISTETTGPESIGYIHLGNGPADWTADRLGILDNFEIEVNTYPPPTGDAIPIVATRLLGPAATNTSLKPWYLAGLDKPVNICFWENGAYQAIRKLITPADSNDMQKLAYYYGFRSFGNGQPA